MRKWILTCLACATAGLQGQDLLVKYDFIKDKFTYLINNKPVSEPVIRRNHEVRVQVENLNPFVFIARCSWKQQVMDDNTTVSGLAGIFSGIGTGPASLGTLLTGLNMKGFEELTSRNGDKVSFLDANMQAKSMLVSAVEEYQKLFQLEQTFQRIDYSSGKLAKLKMNPYIPADTLKRIALELTMHSFAVKNLTESNLTISQFMQWSATLSNGMNESLERLSNYANSFLTEYQGYYQKTNGDFAEAGMDKSVNDMLTAANALKLKYSTDAISAKVEALEQQFESISYTPFTYSCNYLATGDQLSLLLDFFETSGSAHNYQNTALPGGDMTDTLRKIRSKSVNIQIRGDVKIVTSVGVGFPTYFAQNKSWTNRDSMIYGASGNNFSPCVSTFISFYPYTGKNLHAGGTFGIGVPVQNGGNTALNFFLGGSAVIGANSKVVLHGGFAVGQLNVLAAGQKEGDLLGDKTTMPLTTKTFKPGGFIGISFALNK